MTTYNKTTLKTFFETNDVPQGSDYSNLIDSCVNVVETAVQSIASPFNPTELITPRVSAANINVTGILSAASINVAGDISVDRITASAATFAGTVSAAAIYGASYTGGTAGFSTVSAASLNVTGDVSAATGTVYASAMRSTNGLFAGVGIVSATGTTQGAAATLVNIINRGQGSADGTTTGFAIQANRTGLVQYLIHEGAVSANLWPPTGGTINALGANAAFALAANTNYVILHKAASAYAVK